MSNDFEPLDQEMTEADLERLRNQALLLEIESLTREVKYVSQFLKDNSSLATPASFKRIIERLEKMSKDFA